MVSNKSNELMFYDYPFIQIIYSLKEFYEI